MKIYIGYDRREQRAFNVAAFTAREFHCDVLPLREDRLRMSGMLTRPVDYRCGIWDFTSSAPQSTDFAIARFFVPLLCHTGWALFVDADVVFMRDPSILMEYADESKALLVVKHPELLISAATKMDGQPQTSYARKLWSSVMLFNTDHPANRRLNLMTLNHWPGRDLHALSWLSDNEIGTLPPEANWLVGMQPKPMYPMVAHFTLGTPDMPGLESCEYSEIWWRAEHRSRV